LNKHIRHLPGIISLNQLVKDYESNGKWLSDNITISDELKPYINVKGDTLIYSTKLKIDMETTNVGIIVNELQIMNYGLRILITVDC